MLKDNVQLFKGDCLDIMSNIQEGSIDLIVVDPPYEKTQNRWDEIIPLEPMWARIKKVLKPKGVTVFTAAQPYTSMLVMSNPRWFRYDMVWQKTIGSGQLNINRQPLRVHESILVFYENFGIYNEQMTEGTAYKINRKVSKFKSSYGKQRDHVSINTGQRRAKSVIKIKNPRKKGSHDTEKPVSLIEYLVKTYSNEGDTVLDFAMGRGTTGIACLNTNRKFIGIEIDKYWYEEAVKRLKNYPITT